MSRSKRARAAARKRHEAKSPAANLDPGNREEGGLRLGPARRRARITKAGVGVAAVVGLGASMGLARVTYSGHSRHPIEPLSIPQPLYEVVRKNLLQAGILAPAKAPPDATSSTS